MSKRLRLPHGSALELFGLGLEQPWGGLPLLLQPWLCYLERWELLWDWLEDVVTPLSWEKPLLQDSRLDMDPLGWDRADVLLGRQQLRDNCSSHRSAPPL